ESPRTGLGYAPHAQARGAEGGHVDTTSRDLAEKLLLAAPRDEPGAASLHALGRLYLAERKFDEAVSQLDGAASADPNNVQLQNDLGAALLERGRERRERGDGGAALEDFGRSLEHLDRALALDPSQTDALFNRAILDEHMLL